MAFEKQNLKKIKKYLRMWRFKKFFFLKWNSILTFLNLLCDFEENLSTKVALVTNGLKYCRGIYFSVEITTAKPLPKNSSSVFLGFVRIWTWKVSLKIFFFIEIQFFYSVQYSLSSIHFWSPYISTTLSKILPASNG